MDDDLPKIQYSREQLIADLPDEYEHFSNQEVMEDYLPASEYIEQLNGLSDEQLVVATETDDTELTLDEFMSHYQ